MRKQGLTDDCFHVVFNYIIYNRVLYALSAWGDYLTRDTIDSINRLNALFMALRWRLTGDSHNIDELLKQCDSRLFNQCFNSSHCWNHIFTPVNRSSTLNWRERGHPLELPRYNLTRKSFVMRALYEFIRVPLDRTVNYCTTVVFSCWFKLYACM